jgi:hypothetical protein
MNPPFGSVLLTHFGAERPVGTIDNFLGLLAGKTKKTALLTKSTTQRLLAGSGRNEDHCRLVCSRRAVVGQKAG